MDRRNYVRNKRLFVRGEQDTQKYKDQSSDGGTRLPKPRLDKYQYRL
jgi:hypothetical protein